MLDLPLYLFIPACIYIVGTIALLISIIADGNKYKHCKECHGHGKLKKTQQEIEEDAQGGFLEMKMEQLGLSKRK